MTLLAGGNCRARAEPKPTMTTLAGGNLLSCNGETHSMMACTKDVDAVLQVFG